MLRAESAFARASLRPLNGLQMALYREMTSRLPVEYSTPAEPIGDYLYYARTERRRDLPLYCRRHQDGGREETLLDLGALADEHGYAGLGTMSVSPDGALLAYTIDLSGAEEWQLRVVELASGQLVSTRERTHNVEWASHEELVYTQMDERMRPSRAILHTVGRGRGSDAVLLEEKDDAALIDVAATKGRRWLTINSNTRTSSEVWLLETASPRSVRPRLVAPREAGRTYFVEQLTHDGWLLLIANAGARMSGEASPPIDDAYDAYAYACRLARDGMRKGGDAYDASSSDASGASGRARTDRA